TKNISAKVTAPLRNTKNSKNFGLFGNNRSNQAGANLTGCKQDAWRYVAVCAVMGLFFAAIVARAAYLEIFYAQFYIEKGDV
ncbi:penicillin-binding protein 2, partial [Moraxella porci]|nr:penicillin-binding protein 2 [Moraxella porci]